jgi:Acetyl esterase (deacetylase)
MRMASLATALLFAGTALAAEPDAARQAATAYLDGLAEKALSGRAAALQKIATRADAEKRQAQVRAKILSLIGGLPDRSNPLNARITSTHTEKGFRLETVVFDSLPGFLVTGDVFVPEGKGPFPAVIISPGHSPAGKAGDYSMAAAFARAGFVVLAYDIMGEGERLQHYDSDLNLSKLERPTAEHSLAAYQSMLTGKPVVRYFINDAMRGIDYLSSRGDVDAGRIGAFGCSGGGAVTAYTVALDPRIKAGASACFVTTMHALLGTIGPQEGEQSTPGFTAAGLDLADWVELAAPRPYAIVSTTEDMFPFAGARIAHDEAQKFWSLLGAGDNLSWITGPGRHGALAPIASSIVSFFARNLKASGPVATGPDRPALPEDILATPSGQLSTSLGGETLQSIVKADAARLSAVKADWAAAVRSVTRAQAIPGKTKVIAEPVSQETQPHYRLARHRFTMKDGLSFEAVLATPAAVKARLIYLDRTPVSSARLESLTAAGYEVLAPVIAGGGGEEGKAAVLGDYTLFSLRAMLVDRTITGLRIDQAIAAADWFASQKERGPLVIYGAASLGPVALETAVLDTRITKIITAHAPASYRMMAEAPVTRNLPEMALPGVLAGFDLPQLAASLSPRAVVLIDPVDAAGRSLRSGDAAAIFDLKHTSTITWYPGEAEGLIP